MKSNILIGLFSSAVLFLASCAGPQGEKAKTGDAQDVFEATGTSYVADLGSSNIEWIGTKPTGQHNGTIGLSKGFLTVSDGAITGGEIIIDMNSIAVLDLTDPTMNGNLKGHLMSPDFFDVATFPTSSFVITSVEALSDAEAGKTYAVTGNLTMKDVTKSITFPASISFTEDGLSATTDNFIINRADWNIKYGSKRFFDNLKDNFIHDDISLKIKFLGVKE